MAVPLTTEQRHVLQATNDHFRGNGNWPALAAKAPRLRREHGLMIAALLATFPEAPRHGTGLRPTDGDQGGLRPSA